MSPRLLAITLILLLVLGEVGLGVWRNTGIAPSSDPVFSFPPAEARFDKPGEFAPVIQNYGADRGAELETQNNAASAVKILYFEWDQVELSPLMHLAAHAPDDCNIALGYNLEAIEETRIFEVPGNMPLVFDCTRLKHQSGQPVIMFKLAWIQGLGSRQLREGRHRFARLENSLIRHVGAGRVLQCGVFGVSDSDQAWNIFQAEVLSKLSWKESSH